MSVQPGIYQHYKGKRYRVHYVALHSETLEPFVVYEALYELEDGLVPYFVRPLSMFLETVVVDGETVPRFRPVEA